MSEELKAKLTQLKELFEMGLLDEAEYRTRRAALLDMAMGTAPLSQPSLSLSGPTMAGPSSSNASSPGLAVSGGHVLSGPTMAGLSMSNSSSPKLTVSGGHALSGPTVVSGGAQWPSRLGNYKVLGLVGAGGMGTVLRARHDNEAWASRQGGDVALKLIHPEIASDKEFQERFFDEAAIGKRLHHPGLATVYDVVSEGQWLGVVLEYVEGKELSHWVRPGGLAVSEVMELLTPLAEALDYLHSQGVVHRDLKPANVKVREDGTPVLLDLGIAKDLSKGSQGHTQTSTSMGTSAWMAPEQADAKSVMSAADVYALALVAYVLLSGRMPWGEGESEIRVLMNKMMGKLTPLSSTMPDVPLEVSEAVMKALSVNPQERPSSCVAFLNDLGMTPLPESNQPEESVEVSLKQDPTSRLDQDPQIESFTVGLESLHMVKIGPGIHRVGRDDGEDDEKPAHDVEFKRGYSIGKYQVTQGLWVTIMGSNPSYFKDDYMEKEEIDEDWFDSDEDYNEMVAYCAGWANRPVERVNWFDAVTFCNRLSKHCGLNAAYTIGEGDPSSEKPRKWPRISCDFSANGFRLPTEHEWEAAARAGSDLEYAGSDDVHEVAVFDDGFTAEVGTKHPNGWGLYDMSGNVSEYCWDLYGSSYTKILARSGTIDPSGPMEGDCRVVRGGGIYDDETDLRSSSRRGWRPIGTDCSVGFRLARSLHGDTTNGRTSPNLSAAEIQPDKKTENPKKAKSGSFKVYIDRNECIGAGTCVDCAPNVFALDDDNYSVVLDITADTDQDVLAAAQECPMQCIYLFDRVSDEQVYP